MKDASNNSKLEQGNSSKFLSLLAKHSSYDYVFTMIDSLFVAQKEEQTVVEKKLTRFGEFLIGRLKIEELRSNRVSERRIAYER